MSGLGIHGYGAVSPAGWGVGPLRDALAKGKPLPTKPLARPGWEKPLTIRQVPTDSRPPSLAHPRLRRASPIAQFVVAAALEALGSDAPLVAAGTLRLGVVLCAMSGCVNYSRRFYDEVLKDPSVASPVIFPETVFNAPASHIAAVIGTPAMNYTLVGDPGAFLQGVALGAQWLDDDRVDGCLVVGGEESDWLCSDAYHLFSREVILSEGAGALYLKSGATTGALAVLQGITDSHIFSSGPGKAQAARQVRRELPAAANGHLLVDGLLGLPKLDAAEAAAWQDWQGTRLSPKTILGEGLMAAATWQTVLAIDALQSPGYTAASVSVVGCNQQAIGAHFVKSAGNN